MKRADMLHDTVAGALFRFVLPVIPDTLCTIVED